MDINLQEYLSDAEMKVIVREAFEAKVKAELANEDSFKRILTNACYDMVWQKIDETSEVTIEEFLPAKVEEIISDLSEFNLFRKPDAWSRETNTGYQILEREMIKNQDLIGKKVVECVNQAPKKWLRGISEQAFQNIVERALGAK